MVTDSKEYNIGYREYNWMEAITEEIPVAAGATSVSLNSISEQVKNNESYGLLVRMQRDTAYLTDNPTHSRKSKTGTNLINRAAMGTAHINIKVGGVDIFKQVPLEVLGFDIENHDPGTYAQFILPKNIDFIKSKITLDGSLVVDNEVIELVFLPSIERCVIKNKC